MATNLTREADLNTRMFSLAPEVSIENPCELDMLKLEGELRLLEGRWFFWGDAIGCGGFRTASALLDSASFFFFSFSSFFGAIVCDLLLM